MKGRLTGLSAIHLTMTSRVRFRGAKGRPCSACLSTAALGVFSELFVGGNEMDLMVEKTISLNNGGIYDRS